MNQAPKDYINLESLGERLRPLLLNHHEAVEFCQMIMFIAHVWDDLIDGDREVEKETVHWAFYLALIGLPQNAFYAARQKELTPLLMNSILAWMDAGGMEKGDLKDKRIAFIKRAAIMDVFNYCAYILGGLQHARRVGPDLRRIYDENWDEYVKEFENHA